jgi:hypothetical protein
MEGFPSLGVPSHASKLGLKEVGCLVLKFKENIGSR